MKNKSESILARLKNESRKKGISLQQLLNLFCQEEFIRRLAMSNYTNSLILKGGYFLLLKVFIMILIFSELWSLILNYNTGDVELYKEPISIYADMY